MYIGLASEIHSKDFSGGGRAFTSSALATVGLISPDQNLCIAHGQSVDCNPQSSHLCESASQQGLPNQVKNAKALDSEQHMLSFQSAGAVSSLRQSQCQASRQGKGRANSCKFFSHKHYLALFVPLQVVALKTEVC